MIPDMGLLIIFFVSGVWSIIIKDPKLSVLRSNSFGSRNEISLLSLYGCASSHSTAGDPTGSTSSINWQCVGDYTVPFSYTAAGDVQCLSVDGQRCLWEGPCAAKLDVQKFCVPIKPLVCGDAYKALYGVTGYDNPQHWCAKLRDACPTCNQPPPPRKPDCSDGGAYACPADSDCVPDIPGADSTTYHCQKRVVCAGDSCQNGFCAWTYANGQTVYSNHPTLAPQTGLIVSSRCIQYSQFGDFCGGSNLSVSASDYEICQPPLQCYLGPKMPSGAPGLCRNPTCMPQYCFSPGQVSVDGFCVPNAAGDGYQCLPYRQQDEPCGGVGDNAFPFCEPSKYVCKATANGKYTCQSSVCLQTCTGATCLNDDTSDGTCLPVPPPIVATTPAPSTTTTTPAPTTPVPTTPVPAPPRSSYGGTPPPPPPPPPPRSYYGGFLDVHQTPAPMCCYKAPPLPPKPTSAFLEQSPTAPCCPTTARCPASPSVTCSSNPSINCASCVTAGLYTAPAPQSYVY